MSKHKWTGAEVKALRDRLGMTQDEFAHRIGTSVSVISRWECGKRTPTGLYARALDALAAEGKSGRKKNG